MSLFESWLVRQKESLSGLFYEELSLPFKKVEG